MAAGLAVKLAAAALMATGLFVAAVAPNAGAARGIGAVLFYLMMFFAAALGQWPAWLQLATMAGYAAAFGLGAARFFRWE